MIDKNILKKGAIVFFRILPIAIILILSIFIGTHKENITVEQIINFTPKSIPLAILFLLVMYALKSLSFVFPSALLMIVSGSIFNIPTALIVNVVGTAISTSIPFFIGKFSGSDFTESLMKKHQKLEALDALQKNNDFFFAYIARLIGGLPCDAVSMYMGSSDLKYTHYIAGSLLGFIPRIIAYTLIGITLIDTSSPAFIITIVLNIVIAVISLIIYKIVIIKENANKN